MTIHRAFKKRARVNDGLFKSTEGDKGLGRLAVLVSAGLRIVQSGDFARLQAQKTGSMAGLNNDIGLLTGVLTARLATVDDFCSLDQEAKLTKQE